ncbi:MAG: hypothetical protein GSR84_00615 [Desulfurococcales archaeon]|nr:hypothetical protein [Desulfurococcales archaeon]
MGYSSEISIVVSMNQYYDGPALSIAFNAAERLRREYGIHAFVEIENTTLSSPHGGLISYWAAAIMVEGRIVYIDEGDAPMTGDEVDTIIEAILGIATGREPHERLGIKEKWLRPGAYPGESLLEAEIAVA